MPDYIVFKAYYHCLSTLGAMYIISQIRIPLNEPATHHIYNPTSYGLALKYEPAT